MECDDAKELFELTLDEVEEGVLEELRDHLDECRRCKYALRNAKSARQFCEALDLDLGLKEPLTLKRILPVALPAGAVLMLMVLVIVYLATRVPEPEVALPHSLQFQLEECETLEGVSDWAMLAELSARWSASTHMVGYKGFVSKELAARLARRCESPEDAILLREFLKRAIYSKKVRESKVEAGALGNDAWQVKAADEAPAAEARKLAEGIELERLSQYGRAVDVLGELETSAADETVKRRAGLHRLYCSLNLQPTAEVSDAIAAFAKANAGTDQGRVAAHLAEIAVYAVEKSAECEERKRSNTRVPDRQFGTAAMRAVNWETALVALQGEDAYGMATFGRGYALRKLSRPYDSLTAYAECRENSRDSNLAALGAFEAGRQEMALGDYDMGLSRMQDGQERSKKAALSEMLGLFQGFIYLHDYGSATIASGPFKELTIEQLGASDEMKADPLGDFARTVLERIAKDVRTGERDVNINKEIFRADFEGAFADGLAKLGGETKVALNKRAAVRGSTGGAAVEGGRGVAGVRISERYECNETVISAAILLNQEVDRVSLLLKTEDGAQFRRDIYDLPVGEWRWLVVPVGGFTRMSGTGRPMGKTVVLTVIAASPTEGGTVDFFLDDIVIHNGAGFAAMRE